MNEITKVNMMNDAMIPLTSDEGELFKSIFNPTLDSASIECKINEVINLMKEKNNHLVLIENVLRDFLASLENSSATTISTINGCSNTLRKSMFAAVGKYHEKTITAGESAADNSAVVNPIFTTTLAGIKKNEWIYNNVSSIKEKFPGKDPKYTLGEIYTEMKNRNGYDVYDLLDEYRKDKTETVDIIDMVVNSDTLRLSYELCVNKLIEKNKPVVTKVVAPSYKEAHACPAEIRGIISSLSPSGKPTGRHYNKAKDIIKTYNGYNIKKMTRETKKKYKIKSCGEWFAISQYPELVNYLREEISKVKTGA